MSVAIKENAVEDSTPAFGGNVLLRERSIRFAGKFCCRCPKFLTFSSLPCHANPSTHVYITGTSVHRGAFGGLHYAERLSITRGR